MQGTHCERGFVVLLVSLRQSEDLLPQVGSIGEVERRIHSQHQDALLRLGVGVLLQAAPHEGALDGSQRGEAGAGHLHEDLEEGDGDADEQADLNRHKDDAEEGGDEGDEVHLVRLPRGDGAGVVHLRVDMSIGPRSRGVAYAAEVLQSRIQQFF